MALPSERRARRTVEGWRKEGRTDAARHLEHFLDGRGEPIIYNRDPFIRTVAFGEPPPSGYEPEPPLLERAPKTSR